MENGAIIKIALIEKIFTLLELLAKLVIPAWAIVEVAERLAGKDTFADIGFKFLQDGGDKPWELGLISVLLAWGLLERLLRQRKTAYFQDRISKLEKLIDSNRTSSKLSNTGETHPEDR